MQDSESTLSALSSTSTSENGTVSIEHTANGDHSRDSRATGPRTTQGKERSRHNALKHGIFSQVALLKGESRAEFDALLGGLRENLQPEGRLEEMLVEKLALFAWRQRRLIVAETAEIQKAIGCIGWNERDRQAEGAMTISEYSIQHEGGLIRRMTNAKVLERCLELLNELKEGIQEDGFDAERDSQILTTIYGQASGEKVRETLFDSYHTWSLTARCSEDERRQHGYAKPDRCKEAFLEALSGEIKRLERYKKAHSSMEAERRKFDELSQHIPLTPQFDHLVRYEVSLERNFDRTLSQLERLQRMRLGQPVAPKIEVRHSLS